MGIYGVANRAIAGWGDGATLTLNSVEERQKPRFIWHLRRRPRSSDLSVRFFNFELIPSFGFAARTDNWATQVWRNWRGRVQFCYDSDVGCCYVKKD